MPAQCPTCGKKTAYRKNPFRPFCSERCKLIDLGKWVSGVYRLPSEESAYGDSDDSDGDGEDD